MSIVDALAAMFVSDAIYGEGSSDLAPIVAASLLVDAVKLNASITSWQPIRCKGPDAVQAARWLTVLVETLPRGDRNSEIRHVASVITSTVAEQIAATPPMADEKDLRIRELELGLREARMALHDFAQMWSARRDGAYTRVRLKAKIEKLQAIHRGACEAARIQAEGGASDKAH